MKQQTPRIPALMGSLIVTRVVREAIPLHADRNGTSYGAHIDACLAHAVEAGEEMMEVKLAFDEESWQRVREYYAPASVEFAD